VERQVGAGVERGQTLPKVGFGGLDGHGAP
jgi:hypothetical protein